MLKSCEWHGYELKKSFDDPFFGAKEQELIGKTSKSR